MVMRLVPVAGVLSRVVSVKLLDGRRVQFSRSELDSTNSVQPAVMSGVPRLSRELGVDAKAVLAGLDLLEHEGLLDSQGVGRRRIERAAASGKAGAQPLRIGILLTELFRVTPPVIRRVVSWAARVGSGKTDLCQTFTKAEFVEGGTIGPVKG